MGIEIPDSLQWVAKYILGAGDWPEGDETAMRRLADAWTSMADTLNTVDDEAASALNAALTALSEGDTHDAIAAYRDKLLAGDEAAFTAIANYCRKQAELLDDGANDIEQTKLVIIGTMIVAAAELVAAGLTAWTGIGAAAGVAARVAAQVAVRIAMKQLLTRMIARGIAKAMARAALRGAAFEALEEGGIDAAARAIQVAKGDRSMDKFGWSDLALATFGGMVGGAVGGGLGGSKLGGLGDDVSSGLGKLAAKSAVGAGTELAADLSAQVAAAGAGAAFLDQEFKLDVGLDTFTSAGAGGIQSGLESSLHSSGEAPSVPDLGDTNPPGTGSPASPAGTGSPSGTGTPAGAGSPDTGAPTSPAGTGSPGGTGTPAGAGSPDTGAPTSPAGTGTPGGTGTPEGTGTPGTGDPSATAPASTGAPDAGTGAPNSPGDTGSPGGSPSGTGSPASDGTPANGVAGDAGGNPSGTGSPAGDGTPANGGPAGTGTPSAPDNGAGSTNPAGTGTPSAPGDTALGTPQSPGTPGDTSPSASSTPGDTSPASPATPGDTTPSMPPTPGDTSPSSPSTPGDTAPSTPSTPGDTPSTPGATSPGTPSTPGATSPGTPSTPGDTTPNSPSPSAPSTTGDTPSTPGGTNPAAPSAPNPGTPTTPGDTSPTGTPTTTTPSTPQAAGANPNSAPNPTGAQTTPTPSSLDLPPADATTPAQPGISTEPSTAQPNSTTTPSQPATTTPSQPGITTPSPSTTTPSQPGLATPGNPGTTPATDTPASTPSTTTPTTTTPTPAATHQSPTTPSQPGLTTPTQPGLTPTTGHLPSTPNPSTTTQPDPAANLQHQATDTTTAAATTPGSTLSPGPTTATPGTTPPVQSTPTNNPVGPVGTPLTTPPNQATPSSPQRSTPPRTTTPSDRSAGTTPPTDTSPTNAEQSGRLPAAPNPHSPASQQLPPVGTSPNPSTAAPGHSPFGPSPAQHQPASPPPNQAPPHHSQARSLRESLRNLPSQDGVSPAVDTNRNPYSQRPPAYRVRRFHLGGNQWVAVGSVRAHIPNAHSMSPAELHQAMERIQATVDAAFNNGSRLLSGDQFLMDVEFTTDPVAADLDLSAHRPPNDIANALRDHFGLFPAPPGQPLGPDDLREISNDIARANTPARFSDPADSRVVDHHRLGDIEHPSHQSRVEDALRQGNRFTTGADPRTHPYGQLVNDGGRNVPGRSNNCLDCSLSALSSFFGVPRVSAPRYDDRLPNGERDNQSGEVGGGERAEAWLGANYQSYSGMPIPDQYQALHNYIASLGPGSAALVASYWPARDADGNILFHPDGSPVLQGGHATVMVYPPGAPGPVWWDPQSGETSLTPPTSLTANAATMACIPIDANGGPFHAGTGANPGTGQALAGPDTRNEPGIQHPGEQTRLDLPEDAVTSGTEPVGIGPGGLRDQQGDGGDHGTLERGTPGDRGGIRSDDGSGPAAPGLSDSPQSSAGTGLPEDASDRADQDVRGPEQDRIPGRPDVPATSERAADLPAHRDHQEPGPGDPLGSGRDHGDSLGTPAEQGDRDLAPDRGDRDLIDPPPATPGDATTETAGTVEPSMPDADPSAHRTTSPHPSTTTDSPAHENATRARHARESLRSLPPANNQALRVTPFPGRPYLSASYPDALGQPVQVVRLTAAITGLDPAAVDTVTENTQLATDLHFNQGNRFPAGDWLMVDVVPTTDTTTADITIDADSAPSLTDLASTVRTTLGLPPRDTPALTPDDVDRIGSAIDRANLSRSTVPSWADQHASPATDTVATPAIDQTSSRTNDVDLDAIHDQHAENTPAGVSHHRGDPTMGDLPHRVPADPDRFTADTHITPDGFARIGDHTLTPEAYGELLRRTGWDGVSPIRLLGCDASANGFADRLAQHLGVEVLAPNQRAWTDAYGNVISTSAVTNSDGSRSPRVPPDGEWHSHHPSGTTTSHGTDPHPPGTVLPTDIDAESAVDRSRPPSSNSGTSASNPDVPETTTRPGRNTRFRDGRDAVRRRIAPPRRVMASPLFDPTNPDHADIRGTLRPDDFPLPTPDTELSGIVHGSTRNGDPYTDYIYGSPPDQTVVRDYPPRAVDYPQRPNGSFTALRHEQNIIFPPDQNGNIRSFTRSQVGDNVVITESLNGRHVATEGVVRHDFAGSDQVNREKAHAENSTATRVGNEGVDPSGGSLEYDGGHASSFRTTLDRGLVNLFAQERGFNQREFKMLEAAIADWARSGTGRESRIRFVTAPPGAVTPETVTARIRMVDGCGVDFRRLRVDFSNRGGNEFDRSDHGIDSSNIASYRENQIGDTA
ncbi:toxin glutamine deamidase domain-containing protein [Nocardia thailandica]